MQDAPIKTECISSISLLEILGFKCFVRRPATTTTGTLGPTRGVVAPLSKPDRHVLDLEIVADAGEAALAPDAAVLDAAGRGLQAAHPPAVDPDRTGFERARQAQGARDVAGVDAGGEAIAEAVGDLQGLFLGSDVDRHADRPEDFLTGDPGVGVDAIEDRRLDEVAALQVARPLSAGAEARALARALRDVAGDARLLLVGDDEIGRA